MERSFVAPMLLLLFLLFSTGLFAQNNLPDDKVPTSFKNQGEQEEYWIKRFFQKEYKEQKFEIFPGRISNMNNVFIFSNDSLTVYSESVAIKAIFLKGLLYPAIIGGNQINNIEELKFIETDQQKRRFKFLLYRKGLLNPTVCFFELKNVKANKEISLSEFIQNANLTFFRQGWIMI